MSKFKKYLNEGINDKGIFKACFMAGSSASGKAQTLDCKILTIDGWKEMRDIDIGDKVFNPDGGISEVIKIHPQGLKDIYKVSLYDGRETKCCLDHLWKVHGFSSKINSTKRDKNNRKIGMPDWSIRTTKELYEKQDLKYLKNKLSLPLPSIEFKQQDLGIHPYTLGVLLGDGCLKQGRVSITTEDKEIVDKVSSTLNEDYCIKKSTNLQYFINMKNKTNHPKEIKHFYRKELIDLKLDGLYSYEKFIPEKYKNSTKKDRLEIIKGLMDTDGYASKKGQLYFYTTSKKLCDDFRYIVWSLGDNTILHEKMPKIKDKEYRKCYCLTIMSHTPEIYFSLNRKIKRVDIPLQKRNKNHKLKCRIDSITYHGKEDAKCITLDSDDGLYITDNFIVTHNSYVIKQISGGGINPKVVNTDTFVEYHQKFDPEYSWKKYGVKDKILAKTQLSLYLNSILPLWIDGTSSNPSALLRRKGILQSLGYDCAMIFVDTPVETAIKRNKARGRVVDQDFLEKSYEESQRLKSYYSKEFRYFTEILNGEGELTDKVIVDAYKKVGKFFNAPVENPIGQERKEQMIKDGHKYLIDTKDIDKSFISNILSTWYKK